MDVTRRHWTVQKTHGVLPNIRAEVGVALGHLDRAVPQQLLNGLEDGPSHHEV